MSYAGVYGDDETCSCGTYYRSCAVHSRVGLSNIHLSADLAAELLQERVREAAWAERQRQATVDPDLVVIMSED